MGSVGEGPSERNESIPRVRASFRSILRAGSKIGGGKKVQLFFKSVNRKGRMTILFKLEDDDGANGLTEDWSEVKRVCR